MSNMMDTLSAQGDAATAPMRESVVYTPVGGVAVTVSALVNRERTTLEYDERKRAQRRTSELSVLVSEVPSPLIRDQVYFDGAQWFVMHHAQNGASHQLTVESSVLEAVGNTQRT